MRIAIWHNLRSGGGKRALFHQVRGLVERGHHVEAWCPPSADPSFLPLGRLIREHVVPLPPPGRLAKWKLSSSRVDRIRRLDVHCRQCATEIEAGDFDLLMAGPCSFTRAAPIARHTAIPSALYLQEPFRRLYESLPDLPWRALPVPERFSIHYFRDCVEDRLRVRRYRVQAREEWLSARAFDRILVNSLFSRESVLRAYGLDSSVCYLGVDAALFQPKPVPREGFVVSVGGLAFAKGADRAIRALAAIEEAERPELVWIGNFEVPRHRRQIEVLAARHGVRLRVRTRITDDELIDCLSRAAVMLYVPVLEPFGLAPLEANACETPVVALAEGGPREAIRDGVNGRLVPDGDPRALAAALRELLVRPELARRLGKQARAHVIRHWSWDSACDRLERELLRTAGMPTADPEP